MTNLKFDTLSLSEFHSFKLVPKKRVIKHDSNKRLTNRLVKGLCFKTDEGEFKIQVDIRELKPTIIDKVNPDLLILDFTEESYNIKGVITVFDRNPDKNGKYTKYVRNATHCKFFPGSEERYVPFCRNWVCSGHIVRRDGKMMFEFNECIAPKGYTTFMSNEDD